jgi:hypothetical protein
MTLAPRLRLDSNAPASSVITVICGSKSSRLLFNPLTLPCRYHFVLRRIGSRPSYDDIYLTMYDLPRKAVVEDLGRLEGRCSERSDSVFRVIVGVGCEFGLHGEVNTRTPSTL